MIVVSKPHKNMTSSTREKDALRGTREPAGSEGQGMEG